MSAHTSLRVPLSWIQATTTRFFRSPHPRRFRLAEELAALLAEELEPVEAERRAYSSESNFWNQIVERLDIERDRGLIPTFDIVDADRFELSWWASARSGDSRDQAELRRRAAHRGNIEDSLEQLDVVAASELLKRAEIVLPDHPPVPSDFCNLGIHKLHEAGLQPRRSGPAPR